MSGYIGIAPVPQATQTRETYTATASQTTFAAVYQPEFLDVYLNGAKLVNTDDFTATDGNNVVLSVGATSGDVVDIVAFSTFELSSQTFSGTVTATAFAGDGSALTGINAFKPTTVTGATPSLDVGSFNYFDNGTVSADTTVSFASVPTEARWSYTYNAAITGGDWDISTAVYSRGLSVAAQDFFPNGVFFKPDGLKMYMVGGINDSVYEYDLSTAWNISTATFLQLFSVAAQDTNPLGLFFKPDGLKMYVTGGSGQDVNEYNLSTAWDVSTATFLQLFSLATQDLNPKDVFFKPDGLKMYMLGATNDSVYEYNLSTAWNISTAVYSQLFSISAQALTPYGISFKSDGLKMYMTGGSGYDINEYNLSTAWNISTAVYSQRFSVAGVDTSPSGIFFKPDGQRLYISGGAKYSVYEYELGIFATITLPASVEKPPTAAVRVGDQVTYEFVTVDSGTTVTLTAEEVISQ